MTNLDQLFVMTKYPKSFIKKKGDGYVVYKAKYEPFQMLRCFNKELAWTRAKEIIQKEEIK